MSQNLIQIIKQAATEAVEASNPTAILFGRVISTSPLQINVEQKMTLTKDFLILSKNVTDYQINVPVDTETGETTIQRAINGENVNLTHKHNIKKTITITIKNGLAKDDNVILLRIQGGQKYIVLDKLM